MPGDQLLFSNSQEHQRLVAALRESEILRELAELLASSLDLDRILQVLVKRTTEVCQVERCSAWLLEDERGSFHPAAYHLSSQHLNSDVIKAADHIWYRTQLPFDHPIIHRLISERHTFLRRLRRRTRFAPCNRDIPYTLDPARRTDTRRPTCRHAYTG